MIAAATFAGTVDEDFSNESFLQLYAVDVTRTEETGLPPLGRIPLPERVNRLDWSVHGGGEGVVAVALVSGEVQFYSVDAILAGHVQGPLYSIKEHHVGVRACQFNPAQTSLIAIGSDDGKWFVWSLPSGPSGAPQKVALIKNSAQETGVVHVQWHPKFPHIIATSTVGGVVSVWNLKNTSLVAKVGLSRYGNGAYANCVVWHPTVATIFAAGLNEVHSTIQLWDLKKASAPETELEGHVGGVTALDWGGPEDSMLVSCGADGTTFLWESATWKKMGELERQESVIDVRWCPQMETVLAAASLTRC
ncbi:protein transport protein SEC31 [Angomonas deanei]|uniref:WD domain, G-beta repeat, putative n=1 Tax=Angomonas deanei TaxID=59799 RepID=A0A7G2CWV4_9TRYP|nr:protein transport protein SEC31 [Angomonas deanei]CAD2222752.1 WD domain, G-beta repeat, putative [Angomonas deanei]|eukprot:EPY20810.1 protein transport protein SEC31 [Angomonas deanei]